MSLNFAQDTIAAATAAVTSNESELATDSVVNSTAPARRRKARELTDAEVSCAASRLDGTSRTAVRCAIQALGVAPSESQIDEVVSQQGFQLAQRQSRVLRIASQRVGHVVNSLPTLSGRAPARLPVGTPAQRLKAVREKAVKRAATSLFRHGAAGGSSFSIKFAQSSDVVSYQVHMECNWDTYRGKFKGWRANEDHHIVSIPADWRLRVERRGLASLGGMLTLDAHRLDAPSDVQLYAAVWASQGRGYDVSTHRGYICLCQDEAFHGKTPEEAVKGARRKAKAVHGPSSSRPTPYSISIDAFVEKFRGVECDVTLEDARLTGSCEFGIKSWCEAVDLDYRSGSASLDEVLVAFASRPQIEVRRAVVHAVRRHRADIRAQRSAKAASALSASAI